MSGNFNSTECKSCTENNRCEECKKIIEGLIRNFPSIYQFCNGDLIQFILLLRKGFFPYEDMDDWGKLDKTTLPPKEAFYSNLNLENISNEDYAHAQNVWEVFEIKNRSEYLDLYVQMHSCLQMCLKTLEICVLKYMNLILHIMYPHQD